MSAEIIAKCGLICTGCESYLATLSDDLPALTKMAEEASKKLNTAFTWEDCRCFGCQGEGKKIGYCDSCAVRTCAQERGVETCAHCDDYGCEKISTFLEIAPQAKQGLAMIRAKLS